MSVPELYRITELERRVAKLEDQELASDIRSLHVIIKNINREIEDLRKDIDAVETRLTSRLADLREDVQWMKRALVSAIFTLLGGMILFLLSITSGWLG